MTPEVRSSRGSGMTQRFGVACPRDKEKNEFISSLESRNKRSYIIIIFEYIYII